MYKNFEKILKFLPHRFPFLLVDKLIKYKKNFFLKALKNISANDFFFGHFPSRLVFPGVFILEALAQASGLLIFLSEFKKNHHDFFLLTGVRNTRFLKQVYPGDQLILETYLQKNKFNLYKFSSVASVNNIVVCRSLIYLLKSKKY